MTASGKIVSGVRTFAADVTEGFLEITHNSFALIGLAVAFIIIALTARPDLRQAGEERLMGWLQARQVRRDTSFMPEPPGHRAGICGSGTLVRLLVACTVVCRPPSTVTLSSS